MTFQRVPVFSGEFEDLVPLLRAPSAPYDHPLPDGTDPFDAEPARVLHYDGPRGGADVPTVPMYEVGGVPRDEEVLRALRAYADLFAYAPPDPAHPGAPDEALLSTARVVHGFLFLGQYDPDADLPALLAAGFVYAYPEVDDPYAQYRDFAQQLIDLSGGVPADAGALRAARVRLYAQEPFLVKLLRFSLRTGGQLDAVLGC